MSGDLILLSIIIPILMGMITFTIDKALARKTMVLATLLAIFLSALSILKVVNVPTVISTTYYGTLDKFIKVGDFLLLFYTLYISFKVKEPKIAVFSLLQILPLTFFELFMLNEKEISTFYVDDLSIIMNLIVSVIGPIIAIYAFGYMNHHEREKKLTRSRQPRFFAIILVFIGAMNGIIFSNNLMWVYFFWEITSLSSFLLISHDKTEEAIKNASRALWINMMGGFSLLVGIMVLYKCTGIITLNALLKTNSSYILLIPVFFMVLAAFTKSAQMPFQSWLLGAMVAPTPVSALLHSSTMVKAGIYLVLRLAPTFRGSTLSSFIALYGAFTFVATAVLALSQSNAKKILAYSTISNLGLMIASIGINTSSAIAAAILLLIFHAVSKALLFLCVGTIEQNIGSRDIEDMKGLIAKMPVTTAITFLGILSLMIAPFGMLLSKWLAIEAASKEIAVALLLIVGSAVTVMYYTRWIGNLLSEGHNSKWFVEKQPVSIRFSLYTLMAIALGLSFEVTQLFNKVVNPEINMLRMEVSIKAAKGFIGSSMGGFTIYPIFMAIGLAILLSVLTIKKTTNMVQTTPYECGLNYVDTNKGYDVKNYYLSNIINESVMTKYMDYISIALIVVLFGGILL
ncbi:proton-conducting transporter membrane subunit [Thermoanaerobacterium sp. RBIITD]|uniref:NADH-quinone oxidoreductase subunit 5 family protein n=1 Tax=Thermoanaerobacterium sp. RBIITD TaxID=1550240 RepID=UPI000BB7EFBF|nr:proton-conducting transporter membrane subunit [Thermoanaerobacterium sp. RBIITD]SNX53890.1 ech hydrogenase subunit A [Thermoanaerobacterium sp. RBIITD]